jgi:hypothetical protein
MVGQLGIGNNGLCAAAGDFAAVNAWVDPDYDVLLCCDGGDLCAVVVEFFHVPQPAKVIAEVPPIRHLLDSA